MGQIAHGSAQGTTIRHLRARQIARMFSFFRRKKVPSPVEQPQPDADELQSQAPPMQDSGTAAPLEPTEITTPAGPTIPAASAVENPGISNARAELGLPVAPTPAAKAEDADKPTLGQRLAASSSQLGGRLASLLRLKPKLDEELLDEVETILLSADVGIATTEKLLDILRAQVLRREINDPEALLVSLRRELANLLRPCQQDLDWSKVPKPFVLLVVGINGAGKTTTIGKLARRFGEQGLSVMLAAGDTFRAAAVEQLKTWGERNRIPVSAQGPGADSASVIFDAVGAAKARGIDVLIADTAGRLHTQAHLMDELKKVLRVMRKIDPTAPHEVLLVLDGGTGQNAIVQTRQFREAVGVTGLAVTKLDGTAKGGVLFGLAQEFGLPIRFIGVGEQAQDLQPFDADAFARALLPDKIGA